MAHFDNYLTPAADTAGTDGTWGVYPFLPSGNILVSDIENGLFVLRDHARTLDQNVGRVGFTALAANGSEAAGISVRVQRVGGRAGAVAVQYATAAGSAAEGTDYAAGSGTLSWAAGDLADKVVAIPVVDDTVVEGAETLTLTLSGPTSGATIDGSSTLTVTIDDNDAAPPPSGGGGGGGSTDLGLLALLAGTLLAKRRQR